MSDATHSPRQPVRRVLKRHDWLPNRMFDPVNNPFAIQNLLAREREKEDSVFHVDVDGRPEDPYVDNPLLKEKESLPSKDFASNRLLEETTRFDHAFHAEYEDLEYAHENEEAESDAIENSTTAMSAASSSQAIEITEASDATDIADVADAVSQQAADETSVATANTGLDGAHVKEQPSEQTEASGSPAELRASSNDGLSRSAGMDSIATVAGTTGAAAATESALAEELHNKGAPAKEQVSASVVADVESDSETPTSSDATHSEAASEKIAGQPEAEELAIKVPADLPEAASAGAAESTNPEAAAASPESSSDSSNQPADMQAASAGEAAITDTQTEQADAQHGVAGSAHNESMVVSESGGRSVEDQASVSEIADDVSEESPGLSNEALESLLQAAREEARELGRQEAREAAYQEGLQAGSEQTKAELQQHYDDKIAQLSHMIQGLQRLSDDPDTLFEPMKKLAVHLAEQLVRGELTQSSQTISRLVDNCLRELAASGEKAVIVHLNPEDLEQYKPLIAAYGDSIMLRPDAKLARGSVRASLDGSVVEDLIDRRVKGVQKSLSQPVAGSWRPALSNPLTQRSPAQPAKATSKSATVEHALEVDDDIGSAEDNQAEIHVADADISVNDQSAHASADTQADADHLHGDAGGTEVP